MQPEKNGHVTEETNKHKITLGFTIETINKAGSKNPSLTGLKREK